MANACRVHGPRMSPDHEYIVAYIAGSGRSGSTVLDMMLGANSTGLSTGQLDELRSWVESGGYCTCGRVLSECPFWSGIVTSPDSLVPPAVNRPGKVRKVSATLRALAGGANPVEAPEVETAWTLLDRLAVHSGKRAIIDSSKAALRLARLARHPSGDRLRVIHLVRDPRGYVTSVSFSTLAQSAQGTFGYTSAQPKSAAVLDWITQNLLTLIVGVVAFRGRYAVVTYEQMTARPERTLARLAGLLGMKYEPSMLPPLDRTEFHLIGGNSSRLTFSELRYDDKWQSQLRAREKLLIQLTSGWLYWLLARLAGRHERAATA
jgi:hypothetical protein